MLNIGKLGHDAAEYYLETVASGVEDYYLHAGEAPGQWLGVSAHALAMRGEVSGDDLRRVLDGTHPASGEQLGHAQGGRERLPGYDLTFRAPKSVSLLFALGEGEVSRDVKLAHEAAVLAAWGTWSARQPSADGAARAAWCRCAARGSWPPPSSTAPRGPVTRCSTTTCSLPTWSATPGTLGRLDGRLIYTHAKTAGYLYQAELRAQLSRRLGVSWTPVVRGTAEVKGIPAEVIRAFSRRRSQILTRMAERGESSARAAQVATLDTRRAKDHEVQPEGLLPEWRARAAALGLTAERIAAIVGNGDTAARPLTDKSVAKVAAQLVAPTGLTAHSSSFTRRDVVRALCERLGVAADAAAVEGAADAFLAAPEVVALRTMVGPAGGRAVIRVASGRVVPATPDECRFTTEEMLATERQVIEGCLERNAEARERAAEPRQVSPRVEYGVWVVDPRPVTEAAVDDALRARPSLSAEQRAMVRQLTTSPDAVLMVRGHAGTGKTSALDACRQIWEGSGRTVIGCALSGRAAAELQAGAAIQSTTIDRLLLDLVDYRQQLLPRGDAVLVVDEAGMVGTRLLGRLLAAADGADATVVLVGDDRQLPEIDAGGAYHGLCERLGAIRTHRESAAAGGMGAAGARPPP